MLNCLKDTTSRDWEGVREEILALFHNSYPDAEHHHCLVYPLLDEVIAHLKAKEAVGQIKTCEMFGSQDWGPKPGSLMKTMF